VSDAPVFIVGTPRSGTTLTARILARHPRLFMPGECHFFGDIYNRRREIGDLAEPAARQRLLQRLRTLYGRYNEPDDQARVDALVASSDFLRDGELPADYARALDYFMGVPMRAEGKARWGNNVPRDLFHVEDIARLYPQAQFIACARDIRDFLNSYKNRWRVTADEQRERLQSLYHPVLTSLLWRASMRRVPALRRELGPERFHVVRYEDLVARPEEVVAAICEFLGENFEEQMLEVQYSNSSTGAAGGGIGAGSVGAWREGLAVEEVWLAQHIGAAPMVALGYRPEAVDVHRGRLTAHVAATPAALVRALRANRANSGPLLPYLFRRARALLR